MSKSGFECNVEKTFEGFCNMAQADMTRAVKKAISRGANLLKDTTKQNLNGVIKTRGNRHWYDGKEITYSDSIDDGVRRSKVYENDANDLEAKVHVLGSRAKTSGTFRLRFLEAGTKPRYAKRFKGKALQQKRYLGSIRGRRFFQAANNAVLPQLQNIYLEEIAKSVERVNKVYGK